MTRAMTGAAAALCLAAAIVLHAAADARVPPPAVDRPELLYVRSGETLRRLALEHDGIVADLYWMRALQHFGRERLSPASHARTYALVYPFLDLTTTLDPHFTIAYRFGAIFLGEPYPGGPGRADLAIALLRKGLAVQPQNWRYMQDLGFVYYWHLQDYRSAAEWFQRAADQPTAPTWLRPLAAVTLTEGGHRSASRELWSRIAQSEEAWLRDSAQLRLAQLDAMDAIDALQARVNAFRRAHPGAAPSWPSLVAARVIPAIPEDPSGTPYALQPDGTVTVAPQSRLFPLPVRVREGR